MGTIFLASFSIGTNQMYTSRGYTDTRRWEKPLSKINDGSRKLISILNDLLRFSPPVATGVKSNKENRPKWKRNWWILLNLRKRCFYFFYSHIPCLFHAEFKRKFVKRHEIEMPLWTPSRVSPKMPTRPTAQVHMTWRCGAGVSHFVKTRNHTWIHSTNTPPTSSLSHTHRFSRGH